MAFHDVRLPIEVERGVQGGPRFSTSVIVLSSGFEKRNVNWEDSRGAWDLGYGIQEEEDFDVVLDFFYARRGRAHSFRFRDWSDYIIGNSTDITDATARQLIAVGDTVDTTFQIFKRYTSGGINYDRTITKIVSGTLRVWENDIEVFSPAAWSVDELTGIITFVSAPAAVDIEIITEFDVPVRFENDAMDIALAVFNAGEVPQIPVVEVRGE